MHIPDRVFGFVNVKEPNNNIDYSINSLPGYQIKKNKKKIFRVN